MPLNVTPSEKQELLVTMAALVLHDSKLPITAEAITKLVAAAGGVVEPYWPKLFATLLEGRDVGALLLTPGAGAGSAPAGAAAPAAGGAAPAAAKKVEKKKSSSEESGGADMGFSLFD